MKWGDYPTWEDTIVGGIWLCSFCLLIAAVILRLL